MEEEVRWDIPWNILKLDIVGENPSHVFIVAWNMFKRKVDIKNKTKLEMMRQREGWNNEDGIVFIDEGV